MKKTTLAIPFIALAVLAIVFLVSRNGEKLTPEDPAPAIRLVVESESKTPFTHRVGVNLGQCTDYGPEQLMKNMITNPGFEGTVDRQIITVSHADTTGFDAAQKSGDPDGWWDNGQFEVLSGISAGNRGIIASSLEKGEREFPSYTVKGIAPSLKEGDAVLLMQTRPDSNVWIPSDSDGRVIPDTSHARPGSTGVQSLKMVSTEGAPSSVRFFYNGAANEDKGNFLPLNGSWTLTFWMTANNGSGTVDLKFGRANEATKEEKPFLHQTITTTSEWKRYTYHFDIVGASTATVLDLDIQVHGPVTVWLDDMFLGPSQETPTVFRSEVLDHLKQLRPRFVRDSHDGSGDSASNRLADPFSRKSTIVRKGNEKGQPQFLYSIPELLELSKYVGAIPWIVLPATLTDSELDEMGHYLAQNATQKQFARVILEVAGAPDSVNTASEQIIAKRAFDRIAAAAGPDVNLTPAGGEGQFVANEEGSIATLAKRIIENLHSNIQPQVVTARLGSPVNTGKGLVPSSMALAMINKAIGGSFHELKVETNGVYTEEQVNQIAMGAFQTTQKWKAALVSTNDEPVQVSIQFPKDGKQLPNQLLVLDPSASFATKPLEVADHVATFTVPPGALVVLIHYGK